MTKRKIINPKEVIKLYQSGLDLEDIGQIIGVSSTTIGRALKRERIKTRPSKGNYWGEKKRGKEYLSVDGRYYIRNYRKYGRTRSTTKRATVVMEEYLGKKVPIGYSIHHKDGNNINDVIENLELMTHSEHMRLHRIKLTWEQVEKIRKLYRTKKYTQSKLGNLFNVSQGEIGYIVRNEIWIRENNNEE